MKNIKFFIMFFLLVTLISVSTSFAQGEQDNRGRDAKKQYGRIYNPATVETVKGTVSTVDNIAKSQGRYYGIHLVVKTDSEDLNVHLGPSWYINKQGFQITAGDNVTIVGSRVTLDGQTALIASEVEKGGQTLKLRDQDGFPYWSGRRGGGPGKGRSFSQ